ncbi:MAG: PaaI family thioesterase [Desulfitobacterium hafniense]|nr:PaaI family thioesterase [Desulfitobacterium hafniense]
MEFNGINSMCFACGPENPYGLKLKFTEEGDTYKTVFTPDKHYQGYPGILHGGLVSTVLDEVMGRWLSSKGIIAPTGKLEVRFKKPIPVEQPLTLISWMTSEKGRITEMAARAILADGTVAAEAKGVFVRLKEHGKRE